MENVKDLVTLAVNRLDDVYKKIVVLHFYEDLSFEEIGLVLEIPEEKALFWFDNAMIEIKAVLATQARESVQNIKDEILKGVKDYKKHFGREPDFIRDMMKRGVMMSGDIEDKDFVCLMVDQCVDEFFDLMSAVDDSFLEGV